MNVMKTAAFVFGNNDTSVCFHVAHFLFIPYGVRHCCLHLMAGLCSCFCFLLLLDSLCICYDYDGMIMFVTDGSSG